MASDRVGAASGKGPFYTIRIDAVWPSSEGVEKVIIWPSTHFQVARERALSSRSGCLSSGYTCATVVRMFMACAGGSSVLVFRFLGFCGLGLRARVGGQWVWYFQL